VSYHFYRDTAKDPAYWSKACLYNMVKLAREATTLRRVLEPLFHYFDTQNQWSSEKGEAVRVLMYLQSLLEDSGTLRHLVTQFSKIGYFSNFSILIVSFAQQEITPIFCCPFWSSTWIIRMFLSSLSFRLILSTPQHNLRKM